ncbi:MAG: UDP-N-acetylenolpyruvoylglucosamine reductase, partial [Odoribacter sp.]|nr:UDP-N-acetylenolpyruvoylglucosamine reductase [Odoribacter sp.]
IKSEEDAIQIIKNKKSLQKPILILGGGSNIIFTKDFHGTILHTEIEGIKIEEQYEDYIIISSGAGETWDDLVEWTVNKNFGGLENLSLIPGMVGATPVQNIGAYGAEAKDTIEKVRGVSIEDGSVREFSNSECRFGYRDSIFKSELKGKYFVTNVTFRLLTNPSLNTIYGSLGEEARKLGPLSLKTVRAAVINIRRSKLPDPEILGNAGSFFKNPVVPSVIADSLKSLYPEMPIYKDLPGKTKIAAGWLIEKCGWKGFRKDNAGVHEKQALVIVNHGNATGQEIFNLSEEIRNSVKSKFGIELEREVEVI